eukprot:260562_1
MFECFKCNAYGYGYECKGSSILDVKYRYWLTAKHKKTQKLHLLNDKYTQNNLNIYNYSIIGLQCPVGQCCDNPYMDVIILNGTKIIMRANYCVQKTEIYQLLRVHNV